MSIAEESDVRNVTELVSQTAVEMGFSETEAAEVTLAVSEISQNAIRYAGGGEATILSENTILRVIVKDSGPGIENLERAMQKGYSSQKTSLGVGLDVAMRSVDEFEIKSNPEVGTEVALAKFLPIPPEKIEYGIVSFADENYAINGDDYLIKEYDGDKVLMAVIDGTGEGYPAHAISIIIKEYLSSHYRKKLSELAVECHNILKRSESERGAAVALMKIENGEASYLGIGDTHAYILGESKKYMHNHDGTIGLYQLPTLRERKFKLEDNTYLIMCTDGIRSNVDFDDDTNESAQQLANSIFKEYHKEYGDVTVLVAKYFGGL